MLSRLSQLFYGYAEFKAEGGMPERFLTLCAAHDRDVWDICCCHNTITGCVRASEYKNLRLAAKRACMKMRICRKHGFPFLIRRHRFRFGVPVGAAAGIFLLFFLAQFVWNVQIVGNSAVSSERINEVLSANGLTVGVPVKSVDSDNIRQKILLDMPELSWMSVNITGAKMTVEVREKVAREENSDGLPANVVASCDGIVTKVQAMVGSSAVRPGEAVVADDLLISGRSEYENGLVTYRCAAGTVWADTAHTYTMEQPYSYNESRASASGNTKYVFDFFHLHLPLYLLQEKSPCVVVRESQPVVIEGETLPVGLSAATFYPIVPQNRTLTPEEAEENVYQILTEQLKKDFPTAQILSSERRKSEAENGLVLSVTYQCNEIISKSQKIIDFS